MARMTGGADVPWHHDFCHAQHEGHLHKRRYVATYGERMRMAASYVRLGGSPHLPACLRGGWELRATCCVLLVAPCAQAQLLCRA